MKKIFLSICALLAIAGVANAAETKKVPARTNDAYIGVNVGVTTDAYTDVKSVGVTAGYAPVRALALEAAYERTDPRADTATNAVWVNALPTLRLGKLGVYGLGGVGYDFTNENEAYNVGAGVKLELTKAVEVDFRGRRIMQELTSFNGENRVSAGLNFKF